jgi:hypothetical protein
MHSENGKNADRIFFFRGWVGVSRASRFFDAKNGRTGTEVTHLPVAKSNRPSSIRPVSPYF